tara:strand:+ start:436 stop:552 length:117 start_codon:yes stop_codon:yes gene_type:complete
MPAISAFDGNSHLGDNNRLIIVPRCTAAWSSQAAVDRR